ncbi:MAG TPA: hypothetical protein VED40_07130 [Azospirillaceae bacterium]|nr:hypothetical protein [Azospirillaceae bacterium]
MDGADETSRQDVAIHAGTIACALVGGLLALLLERSGGAFTGGMMAGLGLFCLLAGRLSVRVSGEYLVLDGAWVRPFGLANLAGALWFLLG